jgi:GR25 family glycosyltransferase involved in LPS biosynthesis
VHYINLEAERARRIGIEKSFHEVVLHEGWELRRFAAIAAEETGDVSGSISASEKACFLSHRGAIESTLGNDDNDMIVEDDCDFSKSAFSVVEDAVRSLDENKWDILFLEIGISDAGRMVELKSAYDNLIKDRTFCILDLSKFAFHGTLSYVVNKKSKLKIMQKLNCFSILNAPYDLTLRHLCHAGELNAFAIFPFVATHSVHAPMSSIQGLSATDEILNAFRKLMYIEQDLDEMDVQTSHFEQNYSDRQSLIFGRIIAALLSSKFKTK